MAEKSSKTEQKKHFSLFLKWMTIVICVLILETLAVFISVKIGESQNKGDIINFQNSINKFASYETRIEKLESLPFNIAQNTQKVNVNAQAIAEISDGLRNLKEEVGNKKLDNLKQDIGELNHRLEIMEETKSPEVMILGLALMIKENALYHKNYSYEADVLEYLTKDNDSIRSQVEIIKAYKNNNIADNEELVKSFSEIIKSFNFQDKSEQIEKKETTVAKSIKIIKETIADMPFDKVIVLKKEKKTAKQKEIIAKLSNLVNAYNFKEALEFIKNTPELGNANDKALSAWQEKVFQNITFNEALDTIISGQLSALREDIKGKKIESQTKEDEKEVIGEDIFNG